MIDLEYITGGVAQLGAAWPHLAQTALALEEKKTFGYSMK